MECDDPSMPSRPHRTVQRIAQILEFVSLAPEGCTLTEIAKELQAPKSSVQGFVYGLVDAGYLEEQDRRYFLGAAPMVLANRFPRNRRSYVQHDDLAQLAAEIGCSVALGQRMGRSVTYTDVVADSLLNEYLLRRRLRRPAIASAAGQVILAHLPADELSDFLSQEKDEEAVLTFLGAVEEVRATGLRYKEVSLVPGRSVLATAVMDSTGRAVASVVAVEKPERLRKDKDWIGQVMKRAAASWTNTLPSVT
jgi:DNA-binding IclR family transcriptional regulator